MTNRIINILAFAILALLWLVFAAALLMNRDLLEKVWGPEYTNDLQYLRVWISRLRRKLEATPAAPRFIKTYAGIGYMLDLNDRGERS